MMPNCCCLGRRRRARRFDKAMLTGRSISGLCLWGLSRSDWVVSQPRTSILAVFRAMLDRRAKREPLQYITGHAPFRYLDLKVGPGVFIPRPETETVVQAGLDWLTKNGMIHPRVVDLCAGSGAIGLSDCQRGARQPGVGGRSCRRTPPNGREGICRKPRNKYPSIASNYHLEIADATSLRHIGPIGRHRRYRHHQSRPTCRRPIFPSSRKCVIGIRNWLCMAARWTVR